MADGTTTRAAGAYTAVVDGDALYYEVRGQGPPLLLIPGAGGDADQFAPVAALLADEYTVITYDRRANARSTMHPPQNFEVSQQSRDAVAVLAAAGETSAFVFGNSSGAIIALDMATTQPQAVRAVVAHEPPCARVHPQAKRWQRFFASVYLTACRFGSSLALIRFIFGIQVPVLQLIQARRALGPRAQRGERWISAKDAADILAKHELLPVTNYLPDVERIKRNGVSVIMAAGAWGLARNTWYVETARILAQQLGCELATFPGHHGSFMDMPDAWAVTLRRVLHQAEGRDQ
jgi:pimeloyl-ACP methyl ester carboxylesterase